MTVDYLSRHLKRDVGSQDFELPIREVEAGRAVGSANLLFGRVGRIRMRSLWKEAGHARTEFTARKHRRGRL
ncbi:hypothetical protein [Glycomyces arizonensis]|uniref:hypothetical protein n=1 Tax=Glycomyces arizonensis TaxID=256035 RepID=UPI000425BB4D|nr:hypothetical protein [Glycomyces arizonensis]